jgi:putative transposase
MAEIISEYPQFFTATNLSWNKLLERNKYKDVITDSLAFLVNDKRVTVYGFVIMPNHIHLIWQMLPNLKRDYVQRDFLKHTAQCIKEDMIKHYKQELELYLVNAKDRAYQFWERNALSVDLWTQEVLLQKLTYIHENPVRAGLCSLPEDYKYSSALFYKSGIDNPSTSSGRFPNSL